MKNEKEPSEVLSDFLNYIDKCRHDYQTAHDAVGMEDKRLQIYYMGWNLHRTKTISAGPGRSSNRVGGSGGRRRTRSSAWSLLLSSLTNRGTRER